MISAESDGGDTKAEPWLMVTCPSPSLDPIAVTRPLIGVAPPGDLDDNARPRLEDITAFRVSGVRLIKLHVATWHAGPHFVYDECLFVNLENRDTNRRDFHAVPLPVECRYRL
jgi:hypothetical protein